MFAKDSSRSVPLSITKIFLLILWLFIIKFKYISQTHQTEQPQPMFTEDLAALENLTEDAVLDELHARLRQGYFHTFIGDILLIINPNEIQDVYGPHVGLNLKKFRLLNKSDLIIFIIFTSLTQNINANRDQTMLPIFTRSLTAPIRTLFTMKSHSIYYSLAKVTRERLRMFFTW